ncbi:MAG: hypothetical protein WCC57_14625 [Paracoccaceae bacterium]
MRLWIWRVVLLALAAVAVFFAVTLVVPLTTMGDPTYDTAMLRARWWVGFGVPLVQIGVVIGLVPLLFRGSTRWIVLTIGLVVLNCFAMGFEEGRIIAYGDVIGTYEEATARLLVSKWLTFGLALAALLSALLAARRELSGA